MLLHFPALTGVALVLALARSLTGGIGAVSLPWSRANEEVPAVQARQRRSRTEHGIGVRIMIGRIICNGARQRIPCQLKYGFNLRCKQNALRPSIPMQLHPEFRE